MTYNGRAYEGQILDGKWLIGNKTFDSPSGAAGGVALTKNGGKTKLDGWIYWYVKRPDDDNWVSIDSLRPKLSINLEDLDLSCVFGETTEGAKS
jgi:hypothetical protein